MSKMGMTIINYPGAEPTNVHWTFATGYFKTFVITTLVVFVHKNLVYLDFSHILLLPAHLRCAPRSTQKNRRSKNFLPIAVSHLRMFSKYAFCCYTFDCSYNLSWTIIRCWLHEKVHMIFISTYLKKCYPIISQFYSFAYLLQAFIHIFRYDYAAVFCWTDKMVNKIRYIMWVMNINTIWHL